MNYVKTPLNFFTADGEYTIESEQEYYERTNPLVKAVADFERDTKERK